MCVASCRKLVLMLASPTIREFCSMKAGEANELSCAGCWDMFAQPRLISCMPS